MEKKEYREMLKFDRTANCDWCGKRTKVSICHYGTTNYNRLVCNECAKEINRYEMNYWNRVYFGGTK